MSLSLFGSHFVKPWLEALTPRSVCRSVGPPKITKKITKLGIRNGIHGDQEWYTRSSLIGRKSPSTLARRRETSYDVARLLLMVPLEPWRNSTPDFGAAAFCTIKIDDFRASSTSTSTTTSSLRALRWPRSRAGDIKRCRHWSHWRGPARRDK